MKVFLDVVGCRLNQSEMEGVGNTFRALGHEVVADPSQADLAIVNTCAVTVKAAADSRKKLRRVSRLGTPQVVATGCWATLYPEQALELEGVTSVIPNEDKEGLPAALTGAAASELATLDRVREPLPGDRARTRAFIKVQEGCDNHCTYCLTRLARGKSRSRRLMTVRQDIDSAVAGGAKEVVLTGVQLGAWGRDLEVQSSLADLLAGVLSHGGFDRLRLSSIEPWDFDPNLLDFWQDGRLCRHLHIPLQSGDDRILQAMGRPIEAREYKNLVDSIRNAIPGVAITTDVIVGFPGESQAAFENTKAFITATGFSGGHVFTYSPRPGTSAYKMKGPVPVTVAKAHNAELRRLFGQIGQDFRQAFVGKDMEVLWESGQIHEAGGWRLSGLTDNYLRVYALSNDNLWNRFSTVKIQSEIPQRAALKGLIR
jgi:threonylcarbamoyladenosine tRNA methylthiotransferase MtaB